MTNIIEWIEAVEAELNGRTFWDVAAARAWMKDQLAKLAAAAPDLVKVVTDHALEKTRLDGELIGAYRERDMYREALDEVVQSFERAGFANDGGPRLTGTAKEGARQLGVLALTVAAIAAPLPHGHMKPIARIESELRRLQRCVSEHAAEYAGAVRDKRAAQLERNEAQLNLPTLRAELDAVKRERDALKQSRDDALGRLFLLCDAVCRIPNDFGGPATALARTRARIYQEWIAKQEGFPAGVGVGPGDDVRSVAPPADCPAVNPPMVTTTGVYTKDDGTLQEIEDLAGFGSTNGASPRLVAVLRKLEKRTRK